MHKKTKALLQSAVSLLLCVAMLAGSTFAWFSDSVTSSGNIIKSGNLDLEMHWTDDPTSGTWYDVESDGNNTIFGYDNWEPGYTQVRYIKLKNAGNLALKYQLLIKPVGAVGKLADAIDVYHAEGSNARTSLNGMTKLGALTDVMSGTHTSQGTLQPGTDGDITLALTMRTEAGNEYQGESVGAGFTVVAVATQLDNESDSFGTDYDQNATFPVIPNTTITAAVESDADGKTTQLVQFSDGEVSVSMPVGVQLEDGASEVKLTVTPMENSASGVALDESEVLIPVDVHIDGVAADNTALIVIDLGPVMPTGLNMGNCTLYHVEDGVTKPMTLIATDAAFDAHNQFKYDPATGDIIVAMATFSEVALVADTENAWNGTVATAFAGGTGAETDPYIIANADQLAYLNDVVSNGTDTSGKHYKLIADINLGGEENANKGIIFYPIGYHKKITETAVALDMDYAPEAAYIIEEDTKLLGNTVAESGEKCYTYGGSFKGTFDGAGHTISNIYQNTWQMKGNYDGHYWNAAMGLFGYVNGGTVENLTVDSFESDGEFTPTGVIAAYAANSTFENIAITNCNPRVYNTGNGGIVGIGGNTSDPDSYELTFTNITIDNTNKISALWGSWDVACGGLVGMFRGAGHVYMTNCHVAAQIDVYNDVCGNYQYYWYRYAGMMVGTNKNMTTDANGYTVPETEKFHAENCTVHFGEWNDYYYCELVANSLASYTHDHQFSRLTEISSLNEIKSGDTWTKSGNFLLISGDTKTCYHIVNKNGTLTQHMHTDAGEEIVGGKTVLKEDKQIVYLPFNQLFTGYGWGVKHIPVYNGEDYAFAGITILDREVADSVVKFAEADTAKDSYTTESTVTIGELFKVATIADEKLTIKGDKVYVSVSPVGDDSTAGATYTANTTDWTQGTLTFTGVGAATVTITDYYFCKPTTISVTVEPVEKFESKFTGDFLYRVGNQNAVKLDSLFRAKDGVTVGTVDVTVEALNGTAASGTYTSNATWSNGTIQFSGTGIVKVTIEDETSTPTELTLEVVDATNATSATSATKNNVVLLNDCGLNTIEVSNGYTLYGNGFKMTAVNDVRYHSMGVGFVTLNNGTLDNVQIVCPNFSYAVVYNKNITEDGNRHAYDSASESYGNVRSAVMADGNSKIVNSYVHGGRAAIFLRSGNLVVDGSTISGGAAANIHAVSAQSLTLRNATLVQKPFKATVHDTSKTLMGFSGLFECDETGNSTPLILEGTLVQNAWINETYKEYVPSAASSIVTTALGKTDYLHDLDGDGTKESLNLGFTYIPQTSGGSTNANVTDNRTNKDAVPYAAADVGNAFASAKVYSYKNTSGTSENFTNNDGYAPGAQGVTAPTISFTDTNADRVFETVFDSSDNRWESSLTVNLDNGDYTFSWDNLLSQKHGKNLVYTVKTTDDTAVDISKAIALTTSGVTGYVLTVTDGDVTHTMYFTLTATKTSIPEPEVADTTGGTPLLVVKSKNSDWSCAIPALEGIKIKYYTSANNSVTLDLATLTPTSTGKQNGTNNYWEYSNGYSLKVTCGYIHDTKQIYGMPVVVNNDGNKMYFTISSTNGYVSTSTSGRTVTITYEFTDPNGKTLTFSKTWQFNYADYKSGKQYSYSDFVNGTLKEASSGCVTPDTLVTLADGTQKRIDQVTYADQFLVWDFYTGKYTVAPASIVMNHGYDNYKVVTLEFDDGTVVKTINGHGFYTADENEFVILSDNNAEDYLGEKFVKQDGNGYTTTKLVGYSVSQEYTESWSVLTAEHYNCILEGMLTLTPAEVEGSPEYLMPYKIGKNMKYAKIPMLLDIQKYGKYTYEDFAEYVTVEQFDAFGFENFKVSVGKGYITWDEILYLLSIHVG